ncbi:MAG: FG-GAP-like repeat-containing protein [Candidatus Hodarchaeota archaeon]
MGLPFRMLRHPLTIWWFFVIIWLSGSIVPGHSQSLEADIQPRNQFRYLGVVQRVEGIAWGLETIDFDRNGRNDLAMGLDNGSVVILQYKGVGVFKQVCVVANLGKNVRGIAAGDLTGDEFPDLVVGNLDGQVQLLINQGGNGSFVLHPEILADAGSKVYGLAVGDFRDVGALDFIAGNSEGQIIYYENTGNLTFERLQLALAIDVGYNAWGLAAADFDLNGWLDIVVGDTDGEVEIFFNRGNESETLEFSTDAYAPIGIRNPVRIGVKAPRDRTIGVNAYGIGIGDFDNDDFPDVVVGDGVGNVALFYMDENGKLQWAGYLTSAISPYGIAVDDFDQDGDDDVMVGAGAEIGQVSSIKLYLNIPIETGSGTLGNIIGLTSEEMNFILLVLGLVSSLIIGSGMLITLYWYASKLNITVSQLLQEISRTFWMAVGYSFQNISRNKRRTLTLAIGFLVGGALVSAAFIYLDTAPRLGVRSALEESSYEIRVDPDFPWNDANILSKTREWALASNIVDHAEIVYRMICLLGSNHLPDSHYLGVEGEGASNPSGIYISDDWGAFGASPEFFDSISRQFEVEGSFSVDPSSIVISRSFAAEVEQKLNTTIRVGGTLNFSLAQQRPDTRMYDPVYLRDYDRMLLDNIRVNGIYQRKSADQISSYTFAPETLGEAIFFDASHLQKAVFRENKPVNLTESLFFDQFLPSLFIRVDRQYMERIGLLKAAEEIERFAIDLEATFRYVDLLVQTDHIREVESHYQATSIVILFLIVPSVILAVILTLFSTNIVIRGRGREIASLKSRGAGYGELVVMMGSELFVIATAMAIISVFAGLFLAGFIPSSSGYLDLDLISALEFSQQATIPLFAWLGSFLVCEATFLFFTIGPIRRFIYSDIDVAMKQDERIRESFMTKHNIDFFISLTLTVIFILALIADLNLPWLDKDQNRSLYFAGTILLWLSVAYSLSRAVSNFLPNLARLLRSVLGYRVVFVSGNIGRRKTQVVSLILILTFVFSVGTFAAISRDILVSNTREQLEFQVGADLRVQTSGVSSNFTQELEADPAIDQVTGVVLAPAVMGGRSILMLGVDAKLFYSLLRWRDDALNRPSHVDDLFSNFQSKTRLIINSQIASKLELTIGDSALLYAVGGNWGNLLTLEVAGIIDLIPGFGNSSKSFGLSYSRILDKDGGFIIVHKDILTPLVGDNSEILFISIKGGASSQSLKKKLLLRPEVLQITAIDDVKEEEQRSISLFGLSGALLLSFFAAVFLGICSLVIFLNYLVEARRQEYAIMRAGGAKKGQIMILILSEFLFILGVSFIAGLLLGTCFSIIFAILAGPQLPNLSLLAINPIPVSMGNPLGIFFQEVFFILLGSLLVSLCLMILGLLIPARRAGATNVSETLRNL